jgi:membrane-associated protease RseP (regulator of RpoE activity)
MQLDIILFIIFVSLMAIFLIIKRRNITIDKMISVKDKSWYSWILTHIIIVFRYNSKRGVKEMEWLGDKLRKSWFNIIIWILIITSVLGMIYIAYTLINLLYLQLVTPAAIPAEGGIALVLPFKTAHQVYVPFMYWIISIIALVTVHEFSHGILAAYHKIRIKCTGFGFFCICGLPLLPIAFVDIDEKELNKRPAKENISLSAAGPISNIIFALVAALALMSMMPYVNSVYKTDGILIETVQNGSLAQSLGMIEGEVIYSINSINMTSADIFNQTREANKNSTILITTSRGEYETFLGDMLGIMVNINQVQIVPGILPKIAKWLAGLLYWLILLNVGIGMINLAPMVPCDGGRIMSSICKKYLGKSADRVTGMISLCFIILIVFLLVVKLL